MPSRAALGMLFLTPVALLYVVILIVPVSLFLVTSVLTYDPMQLYVDKLTSANFTRILLDPFYRAIILLTIKIAVLTVLCTFVLGYPVALVIARGTSAWRGVLMFLVIAPLMTGEIVRVYGWIVLFGSQGLINRALQFVGIIAAPLQILNSQAAVVIAMVHILLPFMVFPLISALANQDPDLVPAADTLGAGSLRAFLEVTLPLSRPGIVTGSMLVFTLSAGAVVTPSLLGGKNVHMLGQMIYDLVLSTLNWPLAAAAACILVALQLVIVALHLRPSGNVHG